MNVFRIEIGKGVNLTERLRHRQAKMPVGWSLKDGATAGVLNLHGRINDLVVIHNLPGSIPCGLTVYAVSTTGPTPTQGYAALTTQLRSNTGLTAFSLGGLHESASPTESIVILIPMVELG